MYETAGRGQYGYTRSPLGRRSIPAAALALALAAASATWHTFTLNVISRKVTSKVRANTADGVEMNGLQSLAMPPQPHRLPRTPASRRRPRDLLFFSAIIGTISECPFHAMF
uniref:Uncharacterized protein n=1 Tax=Anopheles melas TaxID=34690 RepID=A0A182TEM3_9DIPT